MLPVLSPGSFAVFARRSSYRVGEIVLVVHPLFGRIVKSIARIRDDEIQLQGLSSLSTSCADMGSLRLDAIQGCLVFQIRP